MKYDVSEILNNIYREPPLVIHPLEALFVHVDILAYKPGIFNYWTFITSGIADMELDPGDARGEIYSDRVELAVFVKNADIKEFDADFPWQVNILFNIIGMIQESFGWIDDALVLPNGSPGVEIPGTVGLNNYIFLPPLKEGSEINDELNKHDVKLLILDAISDCEYKYLKDNNSKSSLYSMFVNKNHSHIIDGGRKSYV